jgi:glucose-1-phosphate thymidylyltransferase
MARKGIILAGGNGTRLFPLTYSISKQLLPVYDKPMLLYPIQTVLDAGVDEIIFIVKPDQSNNFYNLISKLHLPVGYKIVLQDEPDGLAQAFILAEEYIKGHSVILALGDNIFQSEGLRQYLRNMQKFQRNNIILGYRVKNPSAYGVAKFDERDELIDVVEKPISPPSQYAIPGLYIFDETVVEKAKNCKKSDRGEYEIVDVIKQYIDEGNIFLYKLPDEAAWFDCGNIDDLLDAGNFVRSVQTRTNLIVGYDANK